MTKDQYEDEVKDLMDEVKELRQQLEAAKHDIDAYRGALGYSVPGTHDGKLTDGTIPQCGICNSEYRKSLEAQLEAAQKACAGKDEILKAEQEHRLIVESVRDSLQNQLEAAQKACAEMRAFIEKTPHHYPKCSVYATGDNCSCGLNDTLSTDCGKGWVSPEKVKALVDIAEKLFDAPTNHLAIPLRREWASAKKDL